ncbi:MAG: cellulose biosynthesis cyclic di-GMP-binding regulatory protein BcsB [Oceanococcaceae bacterium]
MRIVRTGVPLLLGAALGVVPALVAAQLPLTAVNGGMAGQNGAGPTPVAYASSRAGERTILLRDMGESTALRLRHANAQYSVPFSVRQDQYATAATLRYRFAFSPQINALRSQLNVYINDEIVDSLRLAGRDHNGSSHTLTIDPALLVVYNQLRFELLADESLDGSAADACRDPMSSKIWLEISNSSALTLQLESLPVAPDLARLPSPFMDVADSRRVRVPMVLPRNPSATTVRAAATLASWLGAEADYRGAEFPVQFEQLPATGHAIVLREGLGAEDQTNASRARVRLDRHPQDPAGQVLTLSGRSADDLLRAAQALSYSYGSLSGREAAFSEFTTPSPRAAYDAPNWLRMRAEVPLVDVLPDVLSARGLNSGPLSAEFRLPPDLHFFGNQAPRLHFGYRSSVTAAETSSLSVLLNGQFADQTLLTRQADGRSTPEVFSLPAPQVTHRNRLDWQFNFVRNTSQSCEAYSSDEWEGSIDRDARLVFPRHAHYAVMPELSLLRNGAFPFSRQPDGRDTALVIRPNAGADELSALLTLAGYLGRETGLPQWHAEVYVDSPNVLDSDRDLLVVGPLGELALMENLRNTLPLARVDGQLALRRPTIREQIQAYFDERDLASAAAVAGQVLLASGSRLAAFMSVQSPVHSQRTLVFLTGPDTATLPDAALSLLDPGRSQFIGGDLTLVNAGRVTSYSLGPRYAVGRLPLDQRVLRWFEQRPYMIVPLLLLAMLAFVMMVRLGLRHRARG